MLYSRNSWQDFKGLYRLFKAYSDYDRLIFIQKLKWWDWPMLYIRNSWQVFLGTIGINLMPTAIVSGQYKENRPIQCKQQTPNIYPKIKIAIIPLYIFFNQLIDI